MTATLQAEQMAARLAGFRAQEAADGHPSPERAHEIDAEWGRVIDRLLEFWNWPADWDGEGAVPPNRDALRGAITVALQFRQQWSADSPLSESGRMLPPVRVLPSQDGEIILEWHLDHAYCELEVFSPNEARGMVVPKDGSPADHTVVQW